MPPVPVDAVSEVTVVSIALPTPRDPEAWGALSEDERNAVYADYKAINETPGVTPGVAMEALTADFGVTFAVQHQDKGVAGLALGQSLLTGPQQLR